MSWSKSRLCLKLNEMWHNNEEEEGEEEETFGQTSRASVTATSPTGVSTAIFEIRVEGRALGASESSTLMNNEHSTFNAPHGQNHP